MISVRPLDRIRLPVLVSAIVLSVSVVATADESNRMTRLEVHAGQHADGAPTERWLDAAARFNDPAELRRLAATRRPFNADEILWHELILSRLHDWQRMTPELQRPFGAIRPPASVGILIGNLGASDAFIADPLTIAFDLSRLQEVYGAANLPVNAGRIDRFFAHEYTHVLHKIWRQKRQLTLNSPLERALWACLTEGVGNLRSLSDRWRKPDGSLSEHAESVLRRLTPIFVSRLSAIAVADADEADALMQGLSMGPFEEKWGALPVALWLAAETADDDEALSTWIERGPWGVMELAKRHVPEKLAAQLPVAPER